MYQAKDKMMYGGLRNDLEERDQHIERQRVQWRKFKTRPESQSENTGGRVHRTDCRSQQSMMICTTG